MLKKQEKKIMNIIVLYDNKYATIDNTIQYNNSIASNIHAIIAVHFSNS